MRALVFLLAVFASGCVSHQVQVRKWHQFQLIHCISRDESSLQNQFVCEQEAWLRCREAGLELTCAHSKWFP